MIYFWVALMALTFTVLGFLIHAFYFSKQELVEKLYHELQIVENKLAFRERGNANAQEEIEKARALVQSLVRQLEQRDEQLESLKNTTQRQEEEIRSLQEAARELRWNDEREEERKAVASALDGSQFAPEPESEDQKIPLWKDSLNNILSVLDKIENEGSKQDW